MARAGEPASPDVVDELASALGVATLPGEYAEFLLQCNGATPARTLIAVRSGRGLNSAVIDDFLSVSGTYSVLASSRALWEAFRLPRSAAVIGDDHNGNHLVLSLEADSFGAVYFWDHELGTTDHGADDTIADFAQLTQLAATFEVFIAEHLLDQEALDALFEAERESDPAPATPPAQPAEPVDRFAHRVTHIPTPDALDGTEVCRLGSDSGAKQVRISREVLRRTRPNDGKSIGAMWTPPPAMVPDHDPPLDLPFKGSYLLVLNGAAQAALRSTLEPYGEFLDLECEDDGPLTIFRCLNVVDALVPASAIEADPKALDGWMFDPDKTASAGIFTVPQQTDRAWIFYPPSFLRLLAEAGLQHTHFELVWDVTSGPRTLVY